MKEISSFQVLCLRAVGRHSSNTEETFMQTKRKNPRRPRGCCRPFMHPISLVEAAITLAVLRRFLGLNIYHWKRISSSQTSERCRFEASLDFHIIFRCSDDDETLHWKTGALIGDILQSFTNPLVELDRMGDTRLGLHFLQEWQALEEQKQEYKEASSASISAFEKAP